MARRWVRHLLKIAGYGFIVLIVILAGAITFTIGWRPFFGPSVRALTDRKFEPTPERLQRGQYLVESVTGCFACHSKYDDSAQPAPVLISKKGAGRVFLEEGEMRVVSPNITPDKETGIGNWSDDQLARAIREGIGNDGRALFPIMPYAVFRKMSDEDLASVIAYVRTVESAHSDLPKTNLPFPLSRLVNMFPEQVTSPVPPPDVSTPVKRGEYLVTIAACTDCHTPRSKMGKPLAGLEFGGGSVFGDVAAANITPDPTGISYYDEALFVEAFRTGHVKGRALNHVMPWWFYRNMTDEDLKAMFAYLRTLKPAKHRVDNTVPPTECKLCNQKHGLGDNN
jgi:mono/diheme cytochrome c family protein